MSDNTQGNGEMRRQFGPPTLAEHEQALAEALDAGRPMAAGLDVHEHEPRVHPALLDHPRAVLLPHIGSATHEDREDLTDICVTNIVETLAGRIAPFVVPAP